MLFFHSPPTLKNTPKPHKTAPLSVSTAIPAPPPPPPAQQNSRLTPNGASLTALLLLALTLIPAHHASAQIFDAAAPGNNLTYTIVEDASPNTVTANSLTFGNAVQLQVGVFTAQDTDGMYGNFVVRLGAPLSNTAVLTYTLDNDNAAVDALNDGDTLTETFTVAGEQTSGTTGPVSATVTINIQGETDPPTFGAATIPAQSYTPTTVVNLTLPTATGGQGTVMYAITETLPDGLTFTAATRVLDGTPTTMLSMTTFTYTVTDSDTPPDITELPFTITITDLMPTFGATTTIRPQRYAPDEPISVTLPAATGGTGALTYAINPTPPLPDGLTFTAATQVLDGTPTTDQDETTYTYTATDNDATNPDSAQQTFTIAIGQFGTFGNINRAILPEVTRAMMDTTVSAIARRTEQAATDRDASGGATFSLGGQSTLADVLQSNGAALTTGAFNVKSLLGRSAFALPLNQAGGPLAGVTLWGNGAYRNLSGNSATVDWDGDLFGATVGGDAWLTDTLLTGLAVSWADGTFDYTDRSGADPAPGTYQATLTSLHPYVSTSLLDGQVTLWATGGYGWGEVEITDTADPTAEGTVTADTRLATAAVGGAGRLLNQPGLLTPDGTTTVRVKAEALTTAIKAEQQGDRLAGLTTDARRLRLTLEGSHEQPLPNGAHLTPSVGVGLRHDAGDGRTGTGAELSGGLRYAHPALRLTLESRGRVLLAHGGDYDDWSVSGRVTLAPGAQGQGLAVTLAPTYQTTTSAGGLAQLWEHGTANRPAPSGPTTPQGLMEATVAYGLPVGDHLLTPYGGMTLGAADARTYRLGSRVSLAHRLNMSLEGARKGATGTIPVDHGVRVQLEWHW